ncbi:glycosyltransferase [Microscilla marina]|uniref:Glycosyl transferase, group 2 family protein n=1 Tax=Microscilla marina ATCC 23134 TaxID=313606 RepID=A1ZCJ1_MICM2|nr:glycosyltransferase [Microscilla marina]EAY31993.1 glycosyl transferase, group 2 family protein [Microscilla marina ATCC 23134]
MSQNIEPQVSAFDIAIVVCTYNPDEKIFTRLLKAINQLHHDTPSRIECVIVDNNSQKPLSETGYVTKLLKRCKFQSKIIIEEKQGLTAARIAGVQNTSAPIIVFFDDDNEPLPTYLEELQNLFTKYPFVGIWGPGDISVDFLEPVPKAREAWMRGVFQEKHLSKIQYALTTTWTPAHPFGTGLSIRRLSIRKYLEAISNSQYSLSDRKGDSLASAGDTQVVLQAVLDGWAVGVSPDLQLVHIIPAHRTKIAYLRKLMYEVALSSKKALVELMPEEKQQVVILGRFPFIKKIIRHTFNTILRRNSFFSQIQLASYLGNVAASYLILEKKLPKWMSYFIKKNVYQKSRKD